jgi:hypothetical protein
MIEDRCYRMQGLAQAPAVREFLTARYGILQSYTSDLADHYETHTRLVKLCPGRDTTVISFGPCWVLVFNHTTQVIYAAVSCDHRFSLILQLKFSLTLVQT